MGQVAGAGSRQIRELCINRGLECRKPALVTVTAVGTDACSYTERASAVSPCPNTGSVSLVRHRRSSVAQNSPRSIRFFFLVGRTRHLTAPSRHPVIGLQAIQSNSSPGSRSISRHHSPSWHRRRHSDPSRATTSVLPRHPVPPPVVLTD